MPQSDSLHQPDEVAWIGLLWCLILYQSHHQLHGNHFSSCFASSVCLSFCCASFLFFQVPLSSVVLLSGFLCFLLHPFKLLKSSVSECVFSKPVSIAVCNCFRYLTFLCYLTLDQISCACIRLIPEISVSISSHHFFPHIKPLHCINHTHHWMAELSWWHSTSRHWHVTWPQFSLCSLLFYCILS